MNILSVLYCEVLKVLRSHVFWFVFLFFGIGPVMMGIMGNSPADSGQGNWELYLEGAVNTITGVGLVGFSFIAAWVFGREFTDKTVKDLVAKPVSRSCIVSSKFIVIFAWSLLYLLYMFSLSLLTGLTLGLADFAPSLVMDAFIIFSTASLMFIIVATPSAFVANITKGYLAPIGLILVLAIAINALGNTAFAPYFPWLIPALYLKTGSLSLSSIIILLSTGIAGVVGTFAWWMFAEKG